MRTVHHLNLKSDLCWVWHDPPLFEQEQLPARKRPALSLIPHFLNRIPSR